MSAGSFVAAGVALAGGDPTPLIREGIDFLVAQFTKVRKNYCDYNLNPLGLQQPAAATGLERFWCETDSPDCAFRLGDKNHAETSGTNHTETQYVPEEFDCLGAQVPAYSSRYKLNEWLFRVANAAIYYSPAHSAIQNNVARYFAGWKALTPEQVKTRWRMEAKNAIAMLIPLNRDGEMREALEQFYGGTLDAEGVWQWDDDQKAASEDGHVEEMAATGRVRREPPKNAVSGRVGALALAAGVVLGCVFALRPGTLRGLRERLWRRGKA